MYRKDAKVYNAAIASVKGELAELKGYMNKMNTREKSRLQHFNYDRRKHSYLLGRLSTKQAVMRFSESRNQKKIFIDSGVFSFPVIRYRKKTNVQASISHCDNIGVSIVFDECHPMGIDIERIKQSSKDALIKQITATENQLLKSQSIKSITGFTVVWSIKESLSKVLKTGMMLDFKFLEINSMVFKKNVMETTFRHFGQYKALSFFNDDYVITIVLPRNTEGNFTPVWKILDGL